MALITGIFLAMKRFCNDIRGTLSWSTYASIFKGAIAPTISVAAMQSSRWILLWGNFSYLIAVTTMLLPPMLTQAKFIRLLWYNVLYTLISAALTTFGFWLVLQAREHSSTGAILAEPQSHEAKAAHLAKYSPAASLVAAVWLGLQTFIGGVLRDPDDPLLDYSVSCWMILSNFGMAYVPMLPDWKAVTSLLVHLLSSMLVGLALSVGVALFIFPTTCRGSFYSNFEAFGKNVQDLLSDVSPRLRSIGDPSVNEHDHGDDERGYRDLVIQEKFRKITSAQGKLLSQLWLTEVEVGYGLHGQDMRLLCTVLNDVASMARSLGCSLMTSHEESQAAIRCPCTAGHFTPERRAGFNLADIVEKIALIIGHSLEMLHPIDKSGTTQDEEQYHPHDVENLKAILSSLPSTVESEKIQNDSCPANSNACLVHSIVAILGSQAVQFLETVESLSSRGRLSRYVLVLPGWKDWQHYWKDAKAFTISSEPRRVAKTLQSAIFATWQSTSSERAGFAARMTMATLVAASPAFFPATQYWYNREHIAWAQYAVALSMRHSWGHSIQGFILRLIGTIVAACLGMAVWYISRGNAAAVTILYFLLLHPFVYTQTTSLHNSTMGTVSTFALTTVVGYGLQVKALGKAYEQATGSVVSPVYDIGTVRIASIAAGLVLAVLAITFPYPATETQRLELMMQEVKALMSSYSLKIAATLSMAASPDAVRASLRALDESMILAHEDKTRAIRRYTLASKWDWRENYDDFQKHAEDAQSMMEVVLLDSLVMTSRYSLTLD